MSFSKFFKSNKSTKSTPASSASSTPATSAAVTPRASIEMFPNHDDPMVAFERLRNEHPTIVMPITYLH
ncbi:hypothetical protein EC988_003001 [Linderina pennispora]|nr:hypothetical protein EC988_003001 [Linderina pennispora]